MLIDIGFKEGDVITLKLTSGEELVAKLVEDTATHYKLKHVQVIGQGPKGPGLMPYLFTVDPEKAVKLQKATVTVAESTDEVFAKQFLSVTSGIALV
jgi:hypothetical protein